MRSALTGHIPTLCVLVAFLATLSAYVILNVTGHNGGAIEQIVNGLGWACAGIAGTGGAALAAGK